MCTIYTNTVYMKCAIRRLCRRQSIFTHTGASVMLELCMSVCSGIEIVNRISCFKCFCMRARYNRVQFHNRRVAAACVLVKKRRRQNKKYRERDIQTELNFYDLRLNVNQMRHWIFSIDRSYTYFTNGREEQWKNTSTFNQTALTYSMHTKIVSQ